MFWAAVIFLTIGLVGGGFARLGFFLLFNRDPVFVQRVSHGLTRLEILLLAVINIGFSILGFALLFTRTFGPIEIVLAVLVITSLPQVFFHLRKR